MQMVCLIEYSYTVFCYTEKQESYQPTSTFVLGRYFHINVSISHQQTQGMWGI